MADETVQVQISAEVSSLLSGMQQAQDSASSALNSISQSSTQSADSLNKMSEQMGQSTQQMQKMGESTQNLGESLEGFKNTLDTALKATGVLVLAEGFEKLGSAVEHLTERAVNIKNMSEVLGLTTDQFQALSAAADEAGVSEQMLFRAGEGLNTVLNEARDGTGSAIEKLLNLGITTEQVADQSFGMQQLLMQLSENLNNAATKTEVMAELTKDFGARAALAAEAIKAYDGSAAGLASTMSRLNGLNGEQIDALKETAAWWKTLGTEVLNAGGKAIYYEEQMAHGLDMMIAGVPFDWGSRVSQQYAEIQAAALASTKTQTQAAAEASTAQELAEKNNQLIALEAVKGTIDIYKSGSEQRLEILKQYAELAAQYYGANAAEVRAANNAVLVAQRELGDKQVEEAQRAAKERQAVEAQFQAYYQRVEEESIHMVEQRAAADKKDADQRATLVRDSALAQVQAQRDIVAAQSSSGGAGGGDRIGQLKSMLGQEIQIWHDYYDTLRSNAEGSQSAIDAVNRGELDKTAALVKQSVDLQTKAAKQIEQEWMQTFKPIGSAFDQMINGMIRGTTTFHEQVLKLASSLLDSTIRYLTEALEKHVATELAKTGATVAGVETRTLAAAEGAVKSLAIEGAAAIKWIGMEAYKAAAGAFSAMASIPYVGPALAVAAAAAAIIEVGSFASHLSFDKGGIVPYDTMAQVHAGEMVLPREIADGVKSSFGMGRAPAGKGGGDVHHHWAVSTVDAKSFKQALKGGLGDVIAGHMLRYHMDNGKIPR